MARPRNFDEGRAVDAAMRAFWTAGYDGTSTRDLCEATGLGRSSIYNTFDSKHELFGKALARYMEIKTGGLVEVLEDSKRPVRDRLWDVLEGAANPDDGDPLGCFVVNTVVELVPRDPEIAERIERDQRERVDALRAAIETGMASGEIDPGKDADALARFVASTVGGLRVTARGGADRAALRAIAETAMNAI
ncbi:TetR/AcrR family transcriptional regulator [Actinomadura sp. WMMB 499]|uniref:TetR/AcrR family transcriptional regulator n=1 Tax=Actinomadura sp. WMMB 499 TaxID=1219491 RepID=UPI001246B51E|nr:TetR/AcrR family transcriptional regulator [Actinomadura sp. WMMB 499]QFG24888.1 TetR/AcrR family transcriptional regulator [Actinomadura sp. WMMB 499]